MSPRTPKAVGVVPGGAGAGDPVRPCPCAHAGQLRPWRAWCASSAFQTGLPVPLIRSRRWLAVVGSVGQPRDGDPAGGLCDL